MSNLDSKKFIRSKREAIDHIDEDHYEKQNNKKISILFKKWAI